jgi:hypothetical protein
LGGIPLIIRSTTNIPVILFLKRISDLHVTPWSG